MAAIGKLALDQNRYLIDATVDRRWASHEPRQISGMGGSEKLPASLKASVPNRGIFAAGVPAHSRIAAGTAVVRRQFPLLVPTWEPGGLPGTPFSKSVGVQSMAAPIADGTDVWVVVPAAPPLRLTIRACLEDHCRECGLPVYRCESEGGQIMSLCAGHLRLRN
jgi:hypothetical protein